MSYLYDFYRIVGDRVAKVLAKTAITPNQVSFISFLLGVFSAYLFFTANYKLILFAAVILQISTVLDFADGGLARLKSMTSEYGFFLEVILDRLMTVLVLFGVSLGVYLSTENYFALVFGFLGAVFTLLIRRIGLYSLFRLGKKAAYLKKKKEKKEVKSIIRRILSFALKEFGMSTLLLYFLLTLASIFNQLFLFLFVVAVYSFFFLIFNIVYVGIKVKALDKAK